MVKLAMLIGETILGLLLAVAHLLIPISVLTAVSILLIPVSVLTAIGWAIDNLIEITVKGEDDEARLSGLAVSKRESS